MQLPGNTTIYEDSSVEISEDEIKIKKYFFPIPINKHIAFSDINDVFLLTSNNQPGFNALNVFKPTNQNTCMSRKTYIQLWLRNSNSRVTFQPHDPHRVFRIIQDKIRHEQFKQNVNLGINSIKKSTQETYSNILSKLGKFVQDASTKIYAKGHQWSNQLKTKSTEQNKY